MRKYAVIIALQVVFAQIVAMSSAAADKIEKVGNWTYKTLEDKMNDKVRYIAALQISDGALVIKCDERGPHSIYISITSAGISMRDVLTIESTRPQRFKILGLIIANPQIYLIILARSHLPTKLGMRVRF
jgi:hypothetical protein